MLLLVLSSPRFVSSNMVLVNFRFLKGITRVLGDDDVDEGGVDSGDGVSNDI